MTPKRYILNLILFLSFSVDAVVKEYDNIRGEGANLELLSKINQHKDAFKSWMKDHERVYENTEEEVKRLITWVKNHEHIERHNNKENSSSYTLGHNQFSDLTNDEFRRLNFLGDYSPGTEGAIDMFGPASPETSVSRKLSDLPDTVDWVKEGAVTPPKNQGKCGACWAFSSTGAIEGARFIKTGELVSLSEQFLIDCDMVDKGCTGGVMINAFKFDEIEGGICTEKDYPYTMENNRKCGDKTCKAVSGTKVKSFKSLPQKNLNALKVALAQQPVSVAMSAKDLDFQLYRSGVYNNRKCHTQLDHGILAVGYGTDKASGLGYLKVKNSWGDQWGEGGFFRISSDSKPHSKGVCAILSELSIYPILE